MDKAEFQKKSKQFLSTDNFEERVTLGRELYSTTSSFNSQMSNSNLAVKKNEREKQLFDNFITNPDFFRGLISTLLIGTAQKLPL